MLRFFQNNNLLMFLFFPVIAGLIALAAPKEIINSINPEKQVYFYKQLLLLIQGNYFIVFYKIMIAFFLTLNGILFNKFVVTVKINKSNNFFFGFLFLILIGMSSVKTDNLAILIALLIFIFALIIIIKTLRKPFAIFDFLNAGMLISVSFLFWVNTVFFVPMIFIGLFVIRSQQWREWLTAIIGLFLPLFIFLSFYFFIYSNVDVVYDIVRIFSQKRELPNFTTYQIITVSYIFLISLLSSFKIVSRFNTLETDIQDYYKIFFLLFINSLVFFLLKPAILYNVLPFSMLAIVIPFGLGFINIRRKIFAELLFTIFLGFAVMIIINFSF